MQRNPVPLAALVFLCSCLVLGQVPQQSSSLGSLVESNNRFAFKYLRQLQAKNPKDNLLIAPTSLSLAFGVLQNGANSTANQEIAAAFERPSLDLDQLNVASKELITQLTPPKNADPYWDSTMRISNSMWIVPPDSFRPKVASVAIDSYGATTEQLPRDLSARQRTVDVFVTRSLGREFTIRTPLPGKDDFLVISATLFDGKWESEFQKAYTKRKDFKLMDGTRRPVGMMLKRAQFRYLKADHFQAVYLPYTGRYGMYVFLPDDQDGINPLMASLSSPNWNDWMSKFEEHRDGILELPKFRIDVSRMTAAEDYIDLGIRHAFESLRSMQPMVTRPDGAKLTRVIEDASIDLNEERTVVQTRVTVGGVIGGIISGPPPPPPFHMLVDHPFLFAIVDNPTKSILYLGVVTNPPVTYKRGEITDPAEYNAYSAAVNQMDAARRAAMLEAFAQKYPNSVVKADALQLLVRAYQDAGDRRNALRAAEAALPENPNDLFILTTAACARRSMAKEGVEIKRNHAQADKYVLRGLQLLQSPASIEEILGYETMYSKGAFLEMFQCPANMDFNRLGRSGTNQSKPPKYPLTMTVTKWKLENGKTLLNGRLGPAGRRQKEPIRLSCNGVFVADKPGQSFPVRIAEIQKFRIQPWSEVTPLEVECRASGHPPTTATMRN